MLKLILVNIRNTLILLALAYFTIPIVSEAWSAFVPEAADRRAGLPNYKDAPWAERHFQELREQKYESIGYVGWRAKPMSGSTVNIGNDRHRVTPPIPGLSPTPAIYFFGGSTMFGDGSPDGMTIPAYYQGLTHETAVNYGEAGWAAHQSLSELMQVTTSGARPATVVFYDGVNEISNKCRRQSDFSSFYNERSMRDALEYQPTEFGYFWRPVRVAAKAASKWLFGEADSSADKFYDCDTDPKKADLIASALLDDWAAAKYVAVSHGARFFAFLQPVSFLSKTRLAHIVLRDRDTDLRKQFETVYPLIRAKMKERAIGIDLSSALDRDEYFYIDFCHVSPNANQIIAESMAKAMKTSDQPISQ